MNSFPLAFIGKKGLQAKRSIDKKRTRACRRIDSKDSNHLRTVEKYPTTDQWSA